MIKFKLRFVYSINCKNFSIPLYSKNYSVVIAKNVQSH